MRCRPATRATPMLNSSSIRLRRRESVSLGRFQNCNLLEMDHFRRHGVEDEFGVAEAFADGRNVHAFLQQEARMAVADRVEACSLGKPSASGKAWRPFPTTPEAYRARLQHSQMTLRRVSRLLVFSWGLSRCGGAWAHSPLPPPAHRRNPRQALLPRLAAHQHQRKTAGLPETLAESPGCRPCASGALPRRLSPCVPQTEVDWKRYPDNLCEPPLVWSNFI